MKYYRSLTDLLQEHLSMHKARLKPKALGLSGFIARFTLALLRMATVSFPKLALVLSPSAKTSSNYRHIQRFMARYRLDMDGFGRFLLGMVSEKKDFVVSIDRTNWKFGQAAINVLMIAICYRGIAYPLVWRLLPKVGNSNTEERIDLTRRFLRLVPAEKIMAFLADREFIGEDWIGFLHDEGVPFYIRVKKDTEVDAGEGVYCPAYWLFEGLPVTIDHHGTLRMISHECCIFGRTGYTLVGTRYIGREGEPEYLLILTNSESEEALDLYRRRWNGDGTSPIETLFGALKSRGFNLEATHLRRPERLERLVALLSLAFIWVHLVGMWRHNNEKELRAKLDFGHLNEEREAKYSW